MHPFLCKKYLVHYILIHMVKESIGKYPILLSKGNIPPGTVGYLHVMYLKLPVTSCRIQLPTNWEGPKKGWRAEKHKQCNCSCQVKIPHLFSVDVWSVTAPEASAKVHQEKISFVKTWKGRKWGQVNISAVRCSQKKQVGKLNASISI